MRTRLTIYVHPNRTEQSPKHETAEPIECQLGNCTEAEAKEFFAEHPKDSLWSLPSLGGTFRIVDVSPGGFRMKLETTKASEFIATHGVKIADLAELQIRAMQQPNANVWKFEDDSELEAIWSVGTNNPSGYLLQLPK
jgi:hypothetical protein